MARGPATCQTTEKDCNVQPRLPASPQRRVLFIVALEEKKPALVLLALGQRALQALVRARKLFSSQVQHRPIRVKFFLVNVINRVIDFAKCNGASWRDSAIAVGMRR